MTARTLMIYKKCWNKIQTQHTQNKQVIGRNLEIQAS